MPTTLLPNMRHLAHAAVTSRARATEPAAQEHGETALAVALVAGRELELPALAIALVSGLAVALAVYVTLR